MMLDWPLGILQRRPYPATLLFYITIQHFGMASFHSLFATPSVYSTRTTAHGHDISHHTKAFSLYERHHDPSIYPRTRALVRRIPETTEDLRGLTLLVEVRPSSRGREIEKRLQRMGQMRWWKRSGCFHHGKGESEARRRAMSMRMTKRSLYIHYRFLSSYVLVVVHIHGSQVDIRREAQQTVT